MRNWAGTDRCESAKTHLIRRLHEDVIGDLSEGQPQVNDVVLGAASFGKIADVHHAASTRFPLHKLRETKSSVWSSEDISLLPSVPVAPNGRLPPKQRLPKYNWQNQPQNDPIHTYKTLILYHLFTQKIHIFNEQSHPGLWGNIHWWLSTILWEYTWATAHKT